MGEIERRQQLLDLMSARGYMDVRTIAKEFGVSIATARRDIHYLTRENLATRTHGGVYLRSTLSTTREHTINEKRRLMTAEKQAIGRLAGTLVFTGESVLIDAGSTTYEVAKQIRNKRPSTIVCNDVYILSLLAKSHGFNLIDPGGFVRIDFGTLLGPDTVSFIDSLHVNTVFLGTDAVDIIGGVTVTDKEEIAIKRAMIKAADRVVLVSDHSKFGKVVFARVCDLQSVQTIVTDWGILQEQAEQIRSLGVELLIANDDNEK